MSSRAECKTRPAVIVNEFIVYGHGSQNYVLRGLGPSLADFVPHPLQDPTIRLYDVRGNRLDRNDNWMDNPDKDAIEDVGLAPSDDLEPAIIDTLRRGLYTSVVQGNRHGEGIAVSELYDLSDGNLSLSAVRTRAFVGTNDDVLISGIIILGDGPLPLLIRMLGPSLTATGLPDALADPTLEILDAGGNLIFANDNWRDQQESEIEATGLAPTDDLESAAVATLHPGIYTVLVEGVNRATGLGFVQCYSLNAPIRELKPAPIIGRR